MLELAFQWHQGFVEGPTVFRSHTERFGSLKTLEATWQIVGASHLVHLKTPEGEWTEALADPSRLPPGALQDHPIEADGHFEQSGYSIEWRLLPWDEASFRKAYSFPLLHDFGEGAITALDWRWEDALVTESFHAYPEHSLLVWTRSRVEAP